MPASAPPASRTGAPGDRVNSQVLLGLLVSLGAFGVDAMLPALASMGRAFGVGETRAQLVVGVYLLGFSAGQLLFGPLSDAWGRRRVLLAGLAAFWALSGAVAVFRDFSYLLAARTLQGVFAASLRTVGTAWVRDRYRGESMARVMALVQSVFVVAPVLAPWVGAYLVRWGWQAVFLFLATTGALLWVWALAALEESLPVKARRPLAWRSLWEAVRLVGSRRELVAAVLALGSTYGMLYAYLVSAPQLYKTHLRLSNEAFALAFAGTALFQLVAMLVTRALVVRVGLRRLVWSTAAYLFVVTGLLPLHASGWSSPWGLWLHISLVFFGITLTFPNATSLALEPLGSVAGFASSALGFASTFLAGLLGNALGQWSEGDPVRFALGWVVLATLSLAATQWAVAGGREVPLR